MLTIAKAISRAITQKVAIVSLDASGNEVTDSNGNPAGRVVVSSDATEAAVASVLLTFDAAEDMPADITSAANVAADRWEIDVTSISATCQRVQLVFHSENTQTICLGCIVAVDAGDDTTANARLTQVDVTGGDSGLGAGTTIAAGKSDTVTVSRSSPTIEVTRASPITRIDGIGIPGTAIAGIAYLEVRLIG